VRFHQVFLLDILRCVAAEKIALSAGRCRRIACGVSLPFIFGMIGSNTTKSIVSFFSVKTRTASSPLIAVITR